MLIVPEHHLCFVCTPKTASQAVCAWLEHHCRNGSSRRFNVEALHDWHASIEETESSGELPFSLRDAWSFAFVRNPFERFISYCAFTEENFHQDPFPIVHKELSKALSGHMNRWVLPQQHFIKDVNTVFRYEHLAEAIEQISGILEIPADPFTRLNESLHAPYHEYFTGETRAMLETLYRDDLNALGYYF